MFKIDPTANRINPLEVKRFSDLGFTERKHLQEWLENYPQALAQGEGEELLIIQMHIPAHHEHLFRTNVNTDSGST